MSKASVSPLVRKCTVCLSTVKFTCLPTRSMRTECQCWSSRRLPRVTEGGLLLSRGLLSSATRKEIMDGICLQGQCSVLVCFIKKNYFLDFKEMMLLSASPNLCCLYTGYRFLVYFKVNSFTDLVLKMKYPMFRTCLNGKRKPYPNCLINNIK